MLDTASCVADQDESEEVEAQPAPPGAHGAKTKDREPKPLVSPEQLRLLRWALPVLWLVGVIAASQVAGIQLAFLVLAGGVLVLVITLLWVSVQSLTGGATLGFEEALGMGAPSKVEEEKRAVLRALKDLEYERGVGKISPEDYAELSAKYRAQAKKLMQTVDDALAPARVEVERVLERRLAREGLESPKPEPEPARDERDPAPPAGDPEPDAKEPDEAKT